jgi:hypothetical protein
MLNKNNHQYHTMDGTSHTYADIVKKENPTEYEVTEGSFVKWDIIAHDINRVHCNDNKNLTPNFAVKMDLLLDENGQSLQDMIHELQEYYSFKGFLNSKQYVDCVALAEIIARNIHIEEPPVATDESDITGIGSDCEEYY